MAGTRGFGGLRGEQVRQKTLRDYHFDADNKLNEDKIDILFHNHREILEDTKIDVFVQANGKAVAGLGELVVTADVGGRIVSTGLGVEGVVISEKVQIRATGTDSPIGDIDSDVVYGRLTEDTGAYTLTFYSIVGGTEQPYTFGAGAGNVDYRFVVRTNLSVIPVDSIIKGGAGFVEGATDAKAYMNLIQLMKDLYGGSGTLDNDGNANLGTNIVTQIADEIQARTDADTAIRNDLASTVIGDGATLVGVVTDANYTGLTVQAVLSNLASRLTTEEALNNGIASRDANTANDYFLAGNFVTAEGRINDLESKADAALKAQDARLVKLETEDDEEVYEAVGGETEYLLVNGLAKDKTVLLTLNGQVLVPGINFAYIKNGSTQITGFNFAPDMLKGAAQNTDGKPDVLYAKYKRIL
jgi:hypothetical protein